LGKRKIYKTGWHTVGGKKRNYKPSRFAAKVQKENLVYDRHKRSWEKGKVEFIKYSMTWERQTPGKGIKQSRAYMEIEIFNPGRELNEFEVVDLFLKGASKTAKNYYDDFLSHFDSPIKLRNGNMKRLREHFNEGTTTRENKTGHFIIDYAGAFDYEEDFRI
jgi:hypothetical protein